MNNDKEPPAETKFPLFEEDDDFDVGPDDIDPDNPRFSPNGPKRKQVEIIEDMTQPLDDDAAAEKAKRYGVSLPERFEDPEQSDSTVIDATDRFIQKGQDADK